MRYFVVPDIHGHDDLLKAALSFIYKAAPNGCKIIFLGDYVHRDPNSKSVVDILMNPPSGYEFICLRGNHEEIIIQPVATRRDVYEWTTFAQFADKESLKTEILCLEPVYEDWFRSLPRCHRIDQNIFVHSFFDVWLPEDQQDEEKCLEHVFEYDEDWDSGLEDLFLVRGHQPTDTGRPVRHRNRLDLDTAKTFGRMFIAVFEEGRRGPVTTIEI